MNRRTLARAAVAAAGTLALALSLMGSTVAGPADHPVVGRWIVDAEPGGAVWTFQPLGALLALGPGDIESAGTWQVVDEDGAFDATLEVAVSGQTLQILGQVAPDGEAVAMYITATEATRPDDWTPWPAESRLVAEPLSMTSDATPEPSEPVVDCLRPEWIDGAVDWDRCDATLTGE